MLGNFPPAADAVEAAFTIEVVQETQRSYTVASWSSTGALARSQHGISSVLSAVLWSVDQAALCTTAFQILHAGCVAKRKRAILLSAPSQAGKSTLTLSLVKQGWDYLSDELAPVHLDNWYVQPYPCPISLRAGAELLFPDLVSPGMDAAEKRHVAPDKVRAACVSNGAELGAIVLPQFRPGVRCELRRLAPKQALVWLAGARLNNPKDSTVSSFQTVTQLVQRTSSYFLAYGDRTEACSVLDDLADGDLRDAE